MRSRGIKILSAKRAQAAVATAVVLVLGIGPAQAVDGTDTRLKTSTHAAAVPRGGSPGPVFLDAYTVTQPIRVASPGAASLHVVGMTNDSRRRTVVWVRYSLFCTDAQNEQVPFPARWKKAVVPGDPNRVAGITTLARHVVTIRIPSQCVTQPGMPADGFVSYDLAKRRGADPYGGAFANFVVGFAPLRFRKNLALVRDKPDGGPYQAHHTLPRKFAAWFEARGIENIHETTHLLWWCSRKGVRTSHQAMAHEYNRRWQKFKKAHPTASPAKILRFRDSLLDDYVYACP